MSRGFTRRELRQDEFVEGILGAEQWLEEHWRAAAKWGAAAAAATLVVVGWIWWSGQRADRARAQLAEGLTKFEAATTGDAPGTLRTGALDEALALFEESARASRRSALRQVASYYRAASLIRLGRATEAVPVLQTLIASASEPMLERSARALLGKGYLETGRIDDAVGVFRELARGDGAHAQHGLLQLAGLLATQGKTEEAQQALRDLRERFPGSPLAEEATRTVGR
jgi:TolA-binding protein